MIAASWPQHSRRRSQQEILQPRLPARDMDWMTVNRTMPEAEEHAQHRPDRRVLGQARARDDPLDRQKAERSRHRRADQKAAQAAPIAAKRDHDDEGKPNARQGRVRDGVGDQGAFAQKRNVPVAPAANPRSAAPMATSAAL
jgi:hypothetical protein